MILRIFKYGEKVLREKSSPVPVVTDELRTLADDMIETMRDSNGVGIAAPQVGVMRRLFVIEPEPEKVMEFIDPEITEKSGTQQSAEGCLSLPGYIGIVERPEKVRIKAKDRNGEEFELEAEGFEAVVISHEYDHLDGILYKDKARDYMTLEEYEEKYQTEDEEDE